MCYDCAGAAISKRRGSAAFQNELWMGLSGGLAEQDFLWKVCYQKDTFLSIGILGSHGRWAIVVPGWVWLHLSPHPLETKGCGTQMPSRNCLFRGGFGTLAFMRYHHGGD
jgi:hypothetical protein